MATILVIDDEDSIGSGFGPCMNGQTGFGMMGNRHGYGYGMRGN